MRRIISLIAAVSLTCGTAWLIVQMVFITQQISGLILYGAGSFFFVGVYWLYEDLKSLISRKSKGQLPNSRQSAGAINVPEVVAVVKKTPKVTPKKKPKPPVVAKVTPKKAEPKPPAQSGSGSGFFVSRFGHVITDDVWRREWSSLAISLSVVP